LFGSNTKWWYYLVAAVCIIIGLNLLGVFTLSIPTWFGNMRERIGLKGIPGLWHLAWFPVWSPCSAPPPFWL